MYTIRGKVRKGKDRGRTLGYPTANIALHKKIPQGIYISETLFDKTIFPSVTFLGNAKTFGEKQVILETYILDFDRNIYDRIITVRLIKKIRENEKFSSSEKLVAQIAKDVKMAEDYFKEMNDNPIRRG